MIIKAIGVSFYIIEAIENVNDYYKRLLVFALGRLPKITRKRFFLEPDCTSGYE